MTREADRQRLQQQYAASRAAAGAEPRRQLARQLAVSGGNHLDWMNLAFEEFSAYRFPAGHAALAHCVDRAPGFLPARWLQFQYPPEVAPASAAQAAQYRARWSAGLAAFESLDFTDPHWRSQVWGCVGSCTAFYRHYLGDDVLDEQRRYGALLTRMMATLDPGEPPRALRRGRRTVLFCSPYFHQHTVARLFLPLIEALDRERFDIHCLHFGKDDDAMTARARALGQFHAGPREAPDWRRLIGALQPDVIVHLDLGMHPLPQALATLRLAPVQAVLWGHPVTSGLPSIDYVLSPDAFEPADADRHYHEQLIRLPGFGHGLDPSAPLALPTDPAGPLELLCAQSIYKLLPQQDALFARILGALPDARLHLIPHPEAEAREWLRERMRPALAAQGVDADQRLVMHGYRPLEAFRTLAAGCVLNLDSIGWSGGMSSLDLLQLGLPSITLPGATMRSRQTAALLAGLDVAELVVDSDDAYVELAVALARDPARRQTLSTRIRAGLPRLYRRDEVAAALQQFIATCAPPAR
jgi:protein O-GlcNAc transferase